MFENPNETPIVATAPAATSDPAAAPATTVATTETPSAFDVAKFEQSLKQFGPDWTAQNYEQKLAETRQTLGKQGRELGDYKRKYTELEQKAAPLIGTIESDPNFRAGFEQYVRDFYSQAAQQPTMQGYTPQYAAPMQGFDPYVQRMNQIESELRTNQLTQQLNDLAANNFPLTEDMANAVIERFNDPQVGKLGSARDHYMVLFGDKVVALREQLAAKAAVEAIQKNNSAYTPGPSHTAPAAINTSPPDMTGWSTEQFNAYASKRAAEVLGAMRR